MRPFALSALCRGLTLATFVLVLVSVACATESYVVGREPSSRMDRSSSTIALEAEDGLHGAPFSTEAYDFIAENAFQNAADHPLSTFSIDVDTASYANVRRMLRDGMRPPKDSVRIEEFINYFDYDYPAPRGDAPFSTTVEVASAPWQPAHRLVRIGLKGRTIDLEQRPSTNLVFLIDTSGSMSDANKLPLLRDAFKLLVDQLDERDRVSMVVYAGSSGVVLPPTSGANKRTILGALDRLQAGGGTNGASGIERAYQLAEESFIEGGANRVILATDGDFNLGVTSRGDLVRLIEEKAKTGVYLTVLGLGMGNYKDAALEELSRRGNGNYAYIDTLNEARKVLVDGMTGTLITIAKDVKIQVEMNPQTVAAYRLIGYENRMLKSEDFNDDQKDAGEIGAGHTVTALYEIIPVGTEAALPSVDALRYQTDRDVTAAASSGELMSVKLRYKAPDGDDSAFLSTTVRDAERGIQDASEDFRFTAAVAAFGMLLRDSAHKGQADYPLVHSLAKSGRGVDKNGYRAELISLVERAESL